MTYQDQIALRQFCVAQAQGDLDRAKEIEAYITRPPVVTPDLTASEIGGAPTATLTIPWHWVGLTPYPRG